MLMRAVLRASRWGYSRPPRKQPVSHRPEGQCRRKGQAASRRSQSKGRCPCTIGRGKHAAERCGAQGKARQRPKPPAGGDIPKLTHLPFLALSSSGHVLGRLRLPTLWCKEPTCARRLNAGTRWWRARATVGRDQVAVPVWCR